MPENTHVQQWMRDAAEEIDRLTDEHVSASCLVSTERMAEIITAHVEAALNNEVRRAPQYEVKTAVFIVTDAKDWGERRDLCVMRTARIKTNRKRAAAQMRLEIADHYSVKLQDVAFKAWVDSYAAAGGSPVDM